MLRKLGHPHALPTTEFVLRFRKSAAGVRTLENLGMTRQTFSLNDRAIRRSSAEQARDSILKIAPLAIHEGWCSILSARAIVSPGFDTCPLTEL